LARDPLVGERDLRSEDRQLLLDAIMAATDQLIITYTGADERTNAPQPPCVPLGDLLDTLDAMAGGTARDHVCVNHPLQPFDTRNFTPAALGTGGPFSHDRSALAAARRAAEPRQPAPTLRIRGLPAPTITQVSPQELGEFLASPPKAFLKSRLGLSLREEDDPSPEGIPIEMGPLARWHIGNRSLRLLTHGESVDNVAAA
jgi:exodeoxyribonuclease V gamma subunit